MAYRRPGVTVTQEFQNALPALAAFSLPNVNVGPTFQVKSKQNSGSYAGSSVTLSYANQLAGSIADIRASDPTDLLDYPVRIFFQNTVARILNTASTGAVLIGNLNQFTDATSAVFADVAAGDVVVVAGSGVAEVRQYTAVADIAGSLNNTYLDNLYDGLGNGFYIWHNVNGAGTDPALAGKTGIVVAIPTGETANNVAIAHKAAVAAAAGGLKFSTSGAGAQVIITNLNKGAAVDLVDGAAPTLFTGISTTAQGIAVQDGSYTVREKISDNVLRVNETFLAAETSLSYTVRRNLGADASLLEIPTSTAGVVVAVTGVTLPVSLSTTVAPFGSVPILSATVLLTYRALRFDKSADVAPYDDTAELQADFGTDQIVPESPAVFATFLALNNSATETNLLALPQDYLDTGSGSGDELIAYAKAFDVLALTDMYAISVLTQNVSVHTSLKSHVDTFSQPDKKLERVGIINRKLVTTSVVVSAKTNGSIASGGLIFTSSTSQFITDGVVPGHYIKVTLPTPQAGRYKIASIDSQTQVTLETGSAVPSAPVSGLTFTVEKDLTKNDQADVIAAYASSLADRRLVLTWPDVVSLPVGNVIRQVPGFFLNPAIGALTTGLPTQQGLTNLSVAVYTGVVHSTKYFNNDQLDRMADGGVMIFVQEVLDQTPLFVRHQLTTDRSAIKFQEYSVTKNVDFIAKFIRDNHKQFIGQYNIVENTFDDLKTQARGIITFLRDKTKVQRFGGVIRSGKLISIIQDPVNIDAILERYGLDIPIPLNNLDITIVV